MLTTHHTTVSLQPVRNAGVHVEQDYVKYGAITILAASCSNIFNFINAHKF